MLLGWQKDNFWSYSLIFEWELPAPTHKTSLFGTMYMLAHFLINFFTHGLSAAQV